MTFTIDEADYRSVNPTGKKVSITVEIDEAYLSEIRRLNPDLPNDSERLDATLFALFKFPAICSELSCENDAMIDDNDRLRLPEGSIRFDTDD